MCHDKNARSKVVPVATEANSRTTVMQFILKSDPGDDNGGSTGLSSNKFGWQRNAIVRIHLFDLI
jgi:hypothetical protein